MDLCENPREQLRSWTTQGQCKAKNNYTKVGKTNHCIYSPPPPLSIHHGMIARKLPSPRYSLRNEREEWDVHITFWHSEGLPNGLVSASPDLEH